EIADFQFEARTEIVEQLFESEGETVAVAAPAIAVLAVAPLAIASVSIASVSIASVAVAARGKRHGLGAGGADGLHQSAAVDARRKTVELPGVRSLHHGCAQRALVPCGIRLAHERRHTGHVGRGHRRSREALALITASRKRGEDRHA